MSEGTQFNWWEESIEPASIRSDSHEWIYQWSQQALALKAIRESKKAPLRFGAAGGVAREETYKDLLALIEAEGATLAEEAFYVWDDDFEEVFVWPDGAAFITSAEDGRQLGVNIVTLNYDFAEKTREFLCSNLTRKEKTNRGRVYILVSGPEGITPKPLGFAAVPLEVENYSTEIRSQIHKFVDDLKAPFPDGRLTIIEGPPGGGKTFLIRSIVHEVPNAKFVFIPPAMVPSLGDPNLVQSLISMAEDDGDSSTYSGPTVLICEDADSILLQRGQDNMPAISSILNLTSGLLGDVVDVRIIATTNAPKSDIDPALLRSGRLAQYIKVDPVETDQASRILKRLLKDETAEEEWPAAKVPSLGRRGHGVGFQSSGDTEVKGKVLLADVFKVAKNRGWIPKKVAPKVDTCRIVPRRPRSYTNTGEKIERKGVTLSSATRGTKVPPNAQTLVPVTK